MTIAQELYEKLKIDETDTQDRRLLVLDCGHFDSVLGVDEFSTNTVDIATELFYLAEKERRKGLKFLFSVLIDDVGIVCSEDAMICVSKDDHPKTKETTKELTAIPNELLEKLAKTTGFRTSHAKLFSEKTARNRGIQFFRQRVKNADLNSTFEIAKASGSDEQQLFCKLDDGTKVLMADMHTSATWSGHCPLLMGMHYRDVADWATKVIAERDSVEIIDFSLNDDRGKVNAGAQVALGVAADQPFLTRITNICFADEDADFYTIDSHERIKQ